MRSNAWLAIALAVPLTVVGQEQRGAEEEEPQPTLPEQPVPPEEVEPSEEEAAPPPSMPIYIPPSRGAARARVGAGTRGPRRDLARLDVLAPDHAGLTLRAQPVLLWHLASDSSTRVDLVLIDEESVPPLLELSLDPPISRGLHRLEIAQHDIELVPGITYQWFAALVPDPARRSHDVIASGSIRRSERSADLDRELASSPREQRPALLARGGIWYDAIAELDALITERPQDPGFRAQRRALLGQIGVDLVIESP